MTEYGPVPCSLVVITLNESLNIERCLRSAPFVQDLVVLDSGSTDSTVDIAKACGARVFVEPFGGYSKQKIRATELALHSWIISLDADEALSEELAQEIQAQLKNPSSLEAHDAFLASRVSYHLGKWIRHGGWYPDRQIRFFHRERARWREGEIHERLTAQRVGRLKGDIRHWVFLNLSDQVNTNNEYSELGARELKRRGKKFRFALLILKPLGKFFETYVWKRGFLDGMPGFIISVGAAYSMFLKYAKLWELERTKTGNEN